MVGKIKYWNQQKGYGFIIASGIQYFFHHSNFTSEDTPVVGAYVHFNLGQAISPSKPVQAIGVRFATKEEIEAAKNLKIGANALKVGV